MTAPLFLALTLAAQDTRTVTEPHIPAACIVLKARITSANGVIASKDERRLDTERIQQAIDRCSPDGQNYVAARQYFSDCYIEGNVDFIFGDGKAAFNHREIHSTPHDDGFITAQAKNYPSEDSGFVFDHSKLTAAEALMRRGFLGRPWRPYATVIFLNTKMGGQIAPAGWREWHPGETHSLDTAYYAEFNSSGPGARHDHRDSHTHFLTPKQTKHYDPASFLRGSDG